MRSRSTAIVVILSSLLLASASAQAPQPYRVIGSDGARTLPVVRGSGTTDFVALDTLARFFNVAMREDARTGAVVLAVGAQRVALTEGQATVSAGGRLVSLSAPVTRDGAAWIVPIDFLRVLDFLLDRRIDIRRGSRLIVMGTAVVPRVGLQFERTASGGRLVITVEPGATSRITRDGNLVTVRFQADALDLTPIAQVPAEWLANVRADGPALYVELGTTVSNVRQADTQDAGRITLDLLSASPVAPVRPDPVAPAPAIDRPGTMRTVVIDPGHGGADAGSRSASGLEEKQVTLAVAQRLKGMLESRFGLRVTLTRDSDTDVAIDRRAALANNNKADLFISLHANGSPIPAMRGWQVQSLDPAEYGTGGGAQLGGADSDESVPVVGGGLRVIGTVPWRLAQIPHADRSSQLGGLLAARLSEAGLPPQAAPFLQAPLRVLVGANMPAILVEMGFLTNPADAELLGSSAFQGAVAEVLVSIISELRGGWPAPGGGDR